MSPIANSDLVDSSKREQAILGKLAVPHTVSQVATMCEVLLETGETHVLRSRVGALSHNLSIQDLVGVGSRFLQQQRVRKKVETAQLNGFIKGRDGHFQYATMLVLSRIKCSTSTSNCISSGEKTTAGRGTYAHQPQLQLREGKAATRVELDSSGGEGAEKIDLSLNDFS